ncbi:hypothetical protein KR054_001327, partial [Drosophila jambulina]
QKEPEAEEEEEKEVKQQQQLEVEVEQQDQQVRAQLSSVHRAIGGADAPQNAENENVKEEEATPTPTNSNRCTKCNKKLGLTGGFPCRCGGVFCATHRYSDRHECSFDYRELGASEIRRDNPLIVPSKLKKL